MEELLQTVPGVGPVVAVELTQQLKKLKFVGDESLTEEEIRHILRNPKIFYDLPIASQMNLLYNPLKEIPRDIIHILDGELRKYARKIKFDIAGSYRRGKLISHDIDLVMIRGKLDKMISLVNNGSKSLYIYNPYARGEDKATVLFEILVPIELRHLVLLKEKMTTTKKVRVKVDIFLCELKDYMYTMLFATGSGAFNVHMRAVAKKRGYLLNQHGLFTRKNDGSAGKQIPLENEKELFTFLKIAYKTPEERVQ
jgi:DNA polymerase/3'-5' exonuclease PolX